MISNLIFVILFLLIVQSTAKLPSYVRVCKRNDPEVGACYKENFERILPMLKNDLPELSMKSVDPMTISSLHIEHGTQSSPLYFIADVTKGECRGLSATKLIYNNATFYDNGAEMFLHTIVPTTILKGSYKAKGKILLVNFDTDGELTVNLTGVESFCTWHATPYQKNGREHYKHEGRNMKLKFKTGNLNFGNLFPGNPELTESINKAINDNIDSLLKDIEPTLISMMEEILRQTFESVFKAFPADELFPL